MVTVCSPTTSSYTTLISRIQNIEFHPLARYVMNIIVYMCIYIYIYIMNYDNTTTNNNDIHIHQLCIYIYVYTHVHI